MQLVICPYVPSKIWQESFRSVECHLKSTRARDEGGGEGWTEVLCTMKEKRERKSKRAIREGLKLRARARTHKNTHAHVDTYTIYTRNKRNSIVALGSMNRGHFSRDLSVAISVGRCNVTRRSTSLFFFSNDPLIKTYIFLGR